MKDRILDTALALADELGWENVRLRVVADRLGVPMADVLAHYRDRDAVADAWFRRALDAMLAAPPGPPGGARVRLLLLRWLDALAPHRRVTGEMLRGKLYPSHPHHWVPLIFDLSRTVQWLRDAAGLDAGGIRRQAEEIGLTALFLAILAVWVNDDSEGQRRTRDCLERLPVLSSCANEGGGPCPGTRSSAPPRRSP